MKMIENSISVKTIWLAVFTVSCLSCHSISSKPTSHPDGEKSAQAQGDARARKKTPARSKTHNLKEISQYGLEKWWFDSRYKDTGEYVVLGPQESSVVRKVASLHLRNFSMGESTVSRDDRRRVYQYFRNKNLENPGYWVPYYWMALIAANGNRVVEAKKLLMKGIDTCGIKSGLYDLMGEIALWKENDVPRAIKWYGRCLWASKLKKIRSPVGAWMSVFFYEYGLRDLGSWMMRKGSMRAHQRLAFPVIDAIRKRKDREKVRRLLRQIGAVLRTI